MDRLSYGELQLAGMCTRCRVVPADDGSDLCRLHHVASKARKSVWARQRYAARRKAKQCGRCGVDCITAFCVACVIAMGRARKSRDLDAHLDKTERIKRRTVTGEDGRTRYHGQNQRGNQPHKQLTRQDFSFAKRAIEQAIAGFEKSESPETKLLPKIQRDGVRSAVQYQVNLCSGLLDDILDRLGFFKPSK